MKIAPYCGSMFISFPVNKDKYSKTAKDFIFLLFLDILVKLATCSG